MPYKCNKCGHRLDLHYTLDGINRVCDGEDQPCACITPYFEPVRYSQPTNQLMENTLKQIERQQPSKFVPNSYERSNAWAIDQVKQHLRRNNYEVEDKAQEDYGLDIKARLDDGDWQYFEVETKSGRPFTNANDFQFSSVSFLARKKKWADIGFFYVIVCRETEAFVKCHSNVIFQDQYFQTLPIDSRERQGTDHVYRVPNNLCEWGSLK